MNDLLRRGLLIAASALIVFAAGSSYAKKIVPSDQYGRVVINNYSESAGMAPVVFDHWLHRSRFTCRVCHVDIGFAMQAGGTRIRAADNSHGLYCGTCHNGVRLFANKPIFKSCPETIDKATKIGENCDRCHSLGKEVKKEYDFKTFTKNFPKKGLGNGIDWEEAEVKGYIKPADYVEGVSIKKPPLKAQKDFAIESKGTWMSDVIFSHKKHAFWNGCEVCHPEIFPSVKKGTTKYSMFQIYEGEYCGVCHINVAFPLIECQRCHTRPVR
jgi:c(7)-type cytochrome triheme protein